MKKAQIGNITNIVISLVILGVILAVGFFLLTEIKEEMVTGSDKIVNETLTSVNEDGEIVAQATNYDGFKIDSVSACWNLTAAGDKGTLIPADNYTSRGREIYYTGGEAQDLELSYNGTDWNCSYSFSFGEEAYEGINKTVKAIMKIPVWLVIIVIVLIIGIILMILFGIFPSFGTGGAGGKGGSKISFGRGGGQGEAEI